MTRTKQQLANMKSVKDAAPNCRKRKNPAQSERMKERHKEMKWKVTTYEAEWKRAEKELAAEKEVGHNTAVALAQQITKLEDRLAAERERANRLQSQQAKVVEDAAALEQQLAAERGATENWKHNAERYQFELGSEQEISTDLAEQVHSLKQQLAAEQESMVAHARDEVWDELKAERAKVQELEERLRKYEH